MGASYESDVQKDLVDRPEACKILNIAPSTLGKWVAKRRLVIADTRDNEKKNSAQLFRRVDIERLRVQREAEQEVRRRVAAKRIENSCTECAVLRGRVIQSESHLFTAGKLDRYRKRTSNPAQAHLQLIEREKEALKIARARLAEHQSECQSFIN